MPNNPVADLAAVIRNALDFANRAAGEGIEIDGLSPEDFLMEYGDATGNEDWDSFPDRIAAIVSAALSPAANERWQKSSVETWEAMQTMRDAINEHIPMPSLESDLLRGPENSVFCATIAEAVIAGIQARAATAAMDMRERAATHTQWTAWGERHVLTEAARKAIRALPIDPDAQEALDKLLAQTREDAIKEAVVMQGCVSTTRP